MIDSNNIDTINPNNSNLNETNHDKINNYTHNNAQDNSQDNAQDNAQDNVNTDTLDDKTSRINTCVKNLEIEEKKLDKNTNKRRHTGVGVLIITNYNNKPHILVGREDYKSIKINDKYMMSIFEEFGGGIQKRSLSLEENACFELQEETCNIFNLSKPELLNSGINLYFDIPFMDKRIYRLYVIFIENANSIIPYFNENRTYLMNHTNNYFKYDCFLEMNKLELISLDDIKKQMVDRDNYICNSAEDTLFNINSSSNFRGILHIKNDIYLSKRLIDFLNKKFDKNKINNQDKGILNKVENNKYLNIPSNNSEVNKNNDCNEYTGLQYCYKLYEEGFINHRFKNEKNNKVLKLGHPFKNEKHNSKLKFLSGTWSFKLHM